MTRSCERSRRRRAPKAGPSVTPARDLALDVLDAVRSGRYAEEALSEKLDAQCLSREDRALATELAYGVLRWRLRLDSMIARCLDSPKRKLHPRVREILRMAVYQLTLLDRIPDHAAVNEAVNQARSWFGERTAGFVNAVLRTTVRNLDALTTVPDENPQSLAVYYSHPVWLVKQWLDRFGPEGTRGILVHNNSRATLVIRVNRLKTDCDGLVRLLESRGISVTRTIPQPDALLIGSAGAPVRELPGFDEGLFAVQDAASQMVASLLGALPGDRILDACAAPGGKTAHLAAIGDNKVHITAVDSDAPRLEETRRNLERLGVSGVNLVRGDVRDPGFIDTLGTFDRILLDPPCSNLGVLRHNPEVKYRIRPGDPTAFATHQLQMLRTTARALRRGGRLIYSVCTVTPEETADVAHRFLDGKTVFASAPIEETEVCSACLVDADRFLMTFPPDEKDPLDGFFAARFVRL